MTGPPRAASRRRPPLPGLGAAGPHSTEALSNRRSPRQATRVRREARRTPASPGALAESENPLPVPVRGELISNTRHLICSHCRIKHFLLEKE